MSKKPVKRKGVKVIDILSASRVIVFRLPQSTPLEEQNNCPSCDNPLEPVCVFLSGKGKKIRFGLCGHCGYFGYIDRPAKEWMIKFYSQKWDKKSPRTRKEVIKDLDLSKKGSKASRYLAFSSINKIKIDKQRPVCEIGCGYGEVLKNFESAGFKNIIGIEHSNHRADFVEKNFGFKVLKGEFENPDIQNRLKEFKPISVFFSHHVLEHTYSPGEIVNLASLLQRDGDYLILSLPNSDGEHINYGLFYLVHLHSFTKESLELLLNRNGYQIIADNSPDNTNIIITAQKVVNPQPRFKTGKDYYNTFINRLERGLALDQMENNNFYRLSWEQGLDGNDDRKLYKVNKFLGRINWNFKKIMALAKVRLLHRFSRGYSMLTEPISGFDNFEKPPFEIQYPGDIKFLIK